MRPVRSKKINLHSKNALTGLLGKSPVRALFLCELGKLAKDIAEWGLGIRQCRLNTT